MLLKLCWRITKTCKISALHNPLSFIRSSYKSGGRVLHSGPMTDSQQTVCYTYPSILHRTDTLSKILQSGAKATFTNEVLSISGTEEKLFNAHQIWLASIGGIYNAEGWEHVDFVEPEHVGFICTRLFHKTIWKDCNALVAPARDKAVLYIQGSEQSKFLARKILLELVEHANVVNERKSKSVVMIGTNEDSQISMNHVRYIQKVE